MNYKKQYIKLIRKAQKNPLPKYWLNGKKIYVEKHHIFPNSIFGNNKSTTILTAKEHYVAHHLLWKYYQKKYGNNDKRTKSMCSAFWLMTNSEKNKRVSSKIYSKLKEDFSLVMREYILGTKHSAETLKKMSGINNHRFGKRGKDSHNFGLKRTTEQCEKISKARKGKMTGKDHWSFGKIIPLISKQRMSESQKNRPPITEETRQKMRDAQQFRTEDIIRKIKEALPRGKEHHNNKLTLEQIKEIIEKYETNDYTHKALANEYCVGRRLIEKIVNGEHWSSVQGNGTW